MLTSDCFYLQAQKFIAAYSAFLKRQGKLPVPGSFSPLSLHIHCGQTNRTTGWVDTVKTSASNELPPQDADWYASHTHLVLITTS